ncbi:DNA J-binding protein [Angomonas deanei]|uniref:thymine dioxygenase n=1 Tax=Angomonas deanei TaxID=59799 RepID=A0A7G2CL04_9TRYP|nr:DNA J-binding protein [Angomonas deanei]CAD2219253.1 Oxygenase domain of the 2OGFeDO superfamily/Thymine dioxygenase JBP1 DNA-binding domain containing protein, putative [Angomonas deanei]|eukprot:EPY31569.1 DNA J-binding protein [Angomonas deanei]
MEGPEEKRFKPDLLFNVNGVKQDTPEEAEKRFREAIKTHPFYDRAHSVVDLQDTAVMRDGKGKIIGVYIKGGLPAFAASMAADVLRPAATKTSLRSTIYGGEPPNSGIAGYYDYRGSPIEFKSRKTSFTCENAKVWPDVFPLINYVSQIYRHVLPENWEAQNKAIPDVVRLNGSPFSTLTINSRFRTASHTDAGDFDGGFGCIACLEGEFKGMCLTFDHFRINIPLQPCDVLLFDTHHFHSNTEVELNSVGENWSRLTCVFYYRSLLGEPWSYAEYRRRLYAAKKLENHPPLCVNEIIEKDNGENKNKASEVHPVQLSPFSIVVMTTRYPVSIRAKALRLHQLLRGDDQLVTADMLFGEPLEITDGIPERPQEDKITPSSSIPKGTTAAGGFSTANEALEVASELRAQLSDENLSKLISPALFEMWSTGRKKWLDKVKGEWKKLEKRNPDRKNFVWNNQSEMNSDFYDLCEIGKQVMLALLRKESATPQEESSFWTLFAANMKVGCEEELKLPTDAISLKKLNVKLKDFNFGGTRYLKDMPEEEKARRLERKKRIEEARRRGDSREVEKLNWLENDTFDYQTEDRVVDFAGNGWADPVAHAGAITAPILQAMSEAADGKEKDPQGPIVITVVLPVPEATVTAEKPAPPTQPEYEREYQRLAGNPVRTDSGSLPQPTPLYRPAGPPLISRCSTSITIPLYPPVPTWWYCGTC